MTMSKKGLYAITDFDRLDDQAVIERSEVMLKSGISMLQYRNKNDAAKKSTVLTLQELCKTYNTPFIINDDIELAHRIKADGVHLGKSDKSLSKARDFLGSVIIGKSCYNDLEIAINAHEADYVAFGAFYPSQTKPGAVKASISLLEQAKPKINKPIVVIGGITPDNGKVLVEAGADMLAVITALYGSEDIVNTLQRFKSFLHY